MNSQPSEIITHILSYVDNRELIFLRRVCHRWDNLVIKMHTKPLVPPLHVCILNRDYYHFGKYYLNYVYDATKILVYNKKNINAKQYYANLAKLINDLFLTKSILRQKFVSKSKQQVVLSHVLCYGAYMGHIEVVQYMIDHGVNIRVKKDFALVCSSESGHIDVVKLLINHGADIHANSERALWESACKGYLNVVKLLVMHGADIHLNHDTFLSDIAKHGQLEVLKYFVSQGIDVNSNDDVLLKSVLYGHLDIVKYLTNIGCKNDEALRYAADQGHIDIVEYLISQGYDIHARKDSALVRSIYCNQLDMVKYLISQGADIHANNKNYLVDAAIQNHLEMIKCLIDNGADIHKDNDLALQESAHHGRIEIIKYLISQGADIHAEHDIILRRIMSFSYFHTDQSIIKYFISLRGLCMCLLFFIYYNGFYILGGIIGFICIRLFDYYLGQFIKDFIKDSEKQIFEFLETCIQTITDSHAFKQLLIVMRHNSKN